MPGSDCWRVSPAAAVSSLFILGNSLSGLAGLVLPAGFAAMALAVLVAGAVGSRLGSHHWPVGWIRRCLALVLLLAAGQLLGLGA